MGIKIKRFWWDTPHWTASGEKALRSWAVQAAWSTDRSVPISVPPFISASVIKKTKSQKCSQIRMTPWPNTNEILTFYPCLVCKHIFKCCRGGGEGISTPSQLLLARSCGHAPRAPALLREGAASGLRRRGEGNGSRVWCLNRPRTADVAALSPVG